MSAEESDARKGASASATAGARKVRPFPPAAPEAIPPPYGLANTGSICHFNALLQALASCPALRRVARDDADYLARTATGSALAKFLSARTPPPSASAAVLSALLGDVRARRPRDTYGSGQQSASEGLILLLNMTTDESGVPTRAAAAAALESADPAAWAAKSPQAREDATRAKVGRAREAADLANPVQYLFRSRYATAILCDACGEATARRAEMSMTVKTFCWEKNLRGAADPSTALARCLLSHKEEVHDYRCELCGKVGLAVRPHRLERVPEILILHRNVYGARGKAPAFPARFAFNSGTLPFQRVAVIDHGGSLGGGHYVARALRRSGSDCTPHHLNDSGVGATRDLAAGPGTYLLFYHAWVL